MGWTTNGIARTTAIKVTKRVGGSIPAGYPKTYLLTSDYPGVDEVTYTALMQMSDVDYNARLALIKAYIESVESMADFDTNLVAGEVATKADTSCVAGTTTTTESVSTVYPLSSYLIFDGTATSTSGLLGSWFIQTSIGKYTNVVTDYMNTTLNINYEFPAETVTVNIGNINYYSGGIVVPTVNTSYSIDDGVWVPFTNSFTMVMPAAPRKLEIKFSL